MALDKATVARIATLARIKVPEAEREPSPASCRKSSTWIEQLNEVRPTASSRWPASRT